MADPMFDIFAQAVLRGSAAVLSVPDDQGGLRHLKTRFLGQDHQGVYIESVRGEQRAIEAMIAGNQPAGVSFRGGLVRVAFTSRILRSIKDFQVNEGVFVPALLLAFPDSIRPVQRRAHYRVQVTGDCGLRLRLWRIPDHVYIKDRPPAAQEITCIVKNISVGGIGVMAFPKPERPLRLSRADRLRVELVYGGINFIIEGRLRHPERTTDDDPSAGTYLGVQFAKLENNLDGRQTLAALTTIVGELQRAEVRRNKLGIAS